MTHHLKVDGFTFEVSDPNAQAAVERAIAAARKDGEDKLAAEKKRADEAQANAATAQKNASEAQAKHDALAEQAKADAAKMVKCDMCDGSGKCDGCGGKGEYGAKMDTQSDAFKKLVSAKADRRVQERASLIVNVGKVCGANEKTDGRSDIELKKAVITKLSPDVKLDGRDDQYIAVRYDIAMEQFGKTASPVMQARAALSSVPAEKAGEGGVRVDLAPASDPETARQNMINRYHANQAKR